MDLISDILLISGALGAAFYCFVLSRRLSRFTNLEKGVGGAIAVLSAQVDDMTQMLSRAQGTASGSTDTLKVLTERAEDVARRLELLVASMHDLPDSDSGTSNDARSALRATKRETASEPAQRQSVRPVENPKPEEQAAFRSSRAWAKEAAE